MKKIIYCTYFDKGFLLKGLALHASLVRHNPKAQLWVLAFDKYTEKILRKMRLKGATVIALEDFEDSELLRVKAKRKPIEYYWTCTPSWILHVLKNNPKSKYIVYLDADLFFYFDPDKAVSEIDDKSLLVVEHRFPKGYEGMAANGRFNVAFNVFKNDKIGKACLQKWRQQCIEWCYATPKDGRLGDQTYLDEWPFLYGNRLVISKNVGVDTAPWNVSQYKISVKDDSIFVNSDRLVCYHFHQFQILGPSKFSRVHGFTLPANIDKIYGPYETEIERLYKKVKAVDPDFEVKPPSQFSPQIIRQKLAKYLGPTYWKFSKWQKKR